MILLLVYRWYLGIKEITFHWEDCRIFCDAFDHGTNWCVLHLWIFEGTDVNEVAEWFFVCFYVVCSEVHNEWVLYIWLKLYISNRKMHENASYISFFVLLQINLVDTILFFGLKKILFWRFVFLIMNKKRSNWMPLKQVFQLTDT
jgi:hypothetical protein